MGEKKKQGQLQAMWFAAGTAAFMACLERAMLVSFVEQWRAVVFLALNLLLLAILFTSPSYPPPTSANELEPTSLGCPGSIDLDKDEVVMKKMHQFCSREDEHRVDGFRYHSKQVKSRIRKRESKNNVGEIEIAKDKAYELSKEELNERVEAFIATFRQHLVSDAKGKSCRH